MLAFDIETTGLDPPKDKITVAAVCDRQHGSRRCYNLLTGGDDAAEEFLCELDRADALCGYNAVRFDIWFIVRACNVPPHRYEPWILKLFDLFEIARLGFASSCGLGQLLTANGLKPKLADGKQAVAWAESQDYQRLEEYCQDDADMTYDVSAMPKIVIPMNSYPHLFFSRCCDTRAFRFARQ